MSIIVEEWNNIENEVREEEHYQYFINGYMLCTSVHFIQERQQKY